MNEAIKANEWKVHGRDIWVAVEQPLWKRQRNGTLRKALDVAVEMATPSVGQALKPDWAAGELFQVLPEGNPRKLGYYFRKTSQWCWIDSGLTGCGLNIAEVQKSFDIACAVE